MQSKILNSLKLNHFWTFSSLHSFTLLFCLLGYGLVPLLLPGGSILYRGLVLFFSLFLLLIKCIKTFYTKSHRKNYNNKSKKKRLTLNQFTIVSLFLFIILYSFRLIHDVYIIPEQLFLSSSEYLLFWFLISLIPSLVFFLKSKQHVNLSLPIFLILFFISLFSLIKGNSENFGGRLNLEGLNPISLGFYGTNLILCSTILIIHHKNKSVFLKFIHWSGLLIGFNSLIASASRGPFMSLIVSEGLLIFLLFSETHFSLSLKKLKIFISLFFGGVIFYQLVFSNVDSVFFTRIGNMFQAILSNQEVLETVSEGRAFRFNEGLELISSNLAFGYGLELPNGGYPHNLIIESFLSLGIAGGFLFIYIYLYGIFRAIRLIKINGHVNEFFSYFYIQYCVAALFSGNLYASSPFWYLLFYVLSRPIDLKNMNRYDFKAQRLNYN